MTVGELSCRMSAAELIEWVALANMDAREQKKADQQARSRRR